MRRNIRDDFEMVYLRYNDVKKFIGKADPTMASNRDFSKCIDYITSKYYVKNQSFFSKSGFEYEDLRSIAMTFGLTFMGRQIHYGKDPLNFSLMIRYVDQRIFRLYKWIVKKFNMEDVVVIFSEDVIKSSRKSDSNMDINDHRIMRSDHEFFDEGDKHTDIERLVMHKEDVEDIKSQIEVVKGQIKAGGSKKTLVRLRRESIKLEKLLIKVSEKRSELKTKLDERNKINKEWFQSIGTKFYENPQKYTDVLCYYATTKHVSFDVRKKARLICKKYDISYKSWLQSKVKNQNIESAEFSF